MEWYAIINKETGHIKQSNMCGSLDEAQGGCNDSERAVHTGERFSANTHYINVGTDEPEERSISPYSISANSVIADAESEIEITGMTPGTNLTINGPVSGNVDDVEFQVLSFSEPGKYVITITAPFPAIPQEVTIHATQ